MAFPVTTCIIYIATTPEKIWHALTSGQQTPHYFFGRRVESSWDVGAPVTYWMPDGKTVDVEGEVLAYDYPSRLSVSWRVVWRKDNASLPPAQVTFLLEPCEGAVKLTLTEAQQMECADEQLEGGRQGWPAILSSLKSLLETGEAIDLLTLWEKRKLKTA